MKEITTGRRLSRKVSVHSRRCGRSGRCCARRPTRNANGDHRGVATVLDREPLAARTNGDASLKVVAIALAS